MAHFGSTCRYIRRSKTAQGFEPSRKIIGDDEATQVGLELLMVIVVISFDGRFLDDAVHSLHLAVGP